VIAALPARPAQVWVVSSDFFLEGVHFLTHAHPPVAIGYKALARATSDLAAMGATPRFFLLNLALPPFRAGRWLNGFLRGVARATRQFGSRLIGGDIARYTAVAINVTVLGATRMATPVTRSGARPGDLVYVSGAVGAAQLGLELILRGQANHRRWQALLQRHLYPAPRLDLGRWLSSHRLASSMIDTSDGFSTDLHNLCRASKVGARIDSEKLPIVRIPASLTRKGFDAFTLGLHGGEDYELLFTVPRRAAERIPRLYRGVKLTRIGQITRRQSIVLVSADGRTKPLAPRGWDHFRQR
jgi:thiamine-monophosphate kinase